MTKRLIGIDLGQKSLRLAILTREQGIISVVSVTESLHEESVDQMALLQDSLGVDFHLGDRLAACLPGGAAFIRRLTFPFSERKKITAALSFELASQLPVALDDYTTAMQPPVKIQEGAVVVAAAVKTTQLAETLAPFDELGIPLHVLDLAPHAYVAGLKDFLTDGLLVCAMEQGTSLALISSGEVVDYRQLPLGLETSVADQACAIHREATALGQAQSLDGMTLQLMGPLATVELVTGLSAMRDHVELLSIDINGQIIEAPLLPAVALALRAADTGKGQAFNLRQGSFALRGEWVGLRKTLVLAACLAGLTLVTVAASMGLNYYDKQQQADILQQQIVALYQETFPQATTIVDVPLQMKSAIRQLREDVGGIAPDQPSSLHLLRTLSDLPESLTVDIDEFTMERNEVRISGRTSTFEAVNRMAETFRKSPYFEKVEVAESKMDLAGKQVSYRMRMILSGKGASS
ncbi:MAG: PilN domain-containing protein [Desulfuromonadales bacterium]|nr:PilN domain-containing protein [Desulfuromonadales bacterium]